MTQATAVYDSGDGALRRISDWWQARQDAKAAGMSATTTQAKAAPATDSHLVARRALIAFTGLVAVVTFVLSFHGLSDYGSRVAGIEGWQSWLVPVGVDGLTLCAIAATFVLRHENWRVRFYAWCVFAVAIGASVAGNLSHAAERHLKPEGMAGAAAWPILLALASHLVIIARRAADRRDVRPAPKPTPAPVAVPASQPRPAPVTVATVATRKAPVVRDSDAKTRACEMWTQGKSCQDIADALGVSKKSAERYTAELRQGV